jgi:peptide-methionine (S)-S-oxide reductase
MRHLSLECGLGRIMKGLGSRSYLAGRSSPLWQPVQNVVLKTVPAPPWPEGVEVIYLGMGCFWGAERLFWQLEGVYSTAVGYAGGVTPNPTYEEVCTDRTGHAECVLVAYHASVCPLERVLKTFWENHDPTTPNRQGNDVGSQYRSLILCTTKAQLERALASRDLYQEVLRVSGKGQIVTEIRMADAFYYAEEYHQQYLAKHPNGYCGLTPTGVRLPSSFLE